MELKNIKLIFDYILPLLLIILIIKSHLCLQPTFISSMSCRVVVRTNM